MINMSTFVRASKYRHVYCEAPKIQDTFQGIRVSQATGEQNYVKANSLFFATGIQGGGGPFVVLPLNKPGRYDSDVPIVGGHSGPVLDFDFNPFHDQILASASEDQTIKVWGIPEGGLTSNIIEPLVDLHGHARKVTLLRFHPTASNILASTSADQTIKIWDIEKGHEVVTLDHEHEQLIQDVVWDYSGTTYTTSSKDKHVRIIDARSSQVVSMIQTAHEGAKSTKLTYTGALNRLITVGFTRQSQRQFKIWDPRNTSQEVKKVDIDQAAGVIMPFFDPDTNLLFLAGKGDGNVRYYELVNDNPFCFLLSEHRSSVSAKGMAWVPKVRLLCPECAYVAPFAHHIAFRIPPNTTASTSPICFIPSAGSTSWAAKRRACSSSRPTRSSRCRSTCPGSRKCSKRISTRPPPPPTPRTAPMSGWPGPTKTRGSCRSTRTREEPRCRRRCR